MRQIVLFGATLALLAWGGAAQATPVTIYYKGSLSASDLSSGGINPAISFNATQSFGYASLTSTPTAAQTFFTITPPASCLNSECVTTGSGSSRNTIETENFTINLTLSTNSNLSGGVTITKSGVFTADYSGKTMTCSGTDNPADCFLWNGSVPGTSGTGVLNLGNINVGGNLVDVILDNAFDWNVTPAVKASPIRLGPRSRLQLACWASGWLALVSHRCEGAIAPDRHPATSPVAWCGRGV